MAACLVPLHDPIRLAEQLAVLDLASGGRVGIVAGTGYVRSEFEMAGLDRAERVALQEEAVETILACYERRCAHVPAAPHKAAAE